MARIRSVHPGLFTDEAFASASMAARVLIVGIWTEAWDDGVFEWRPLRLKMRIFPADVIEVAPLLAELEALDIVRRFSANGADYGAIRNFCKFQRPKKPSYSGRLPHPLLKYASFSPTHGGIDEDQSSIGSEPVPNQSEIGTEKTDQKGGREEGRKEEDNCSLRSQSSERPSPVPDVPAPDDETNQDLRPRKARADDDSELILDLVDQWNETAASCGLPSIRDITPRRQSALRARVRDLASMGFDDPRSGFAQLMANIRGSPFLTGQSARGFRADFDFATNSSKFHRIMEGSYGAHESSQQGRH